MNTPSSSVFDDLEKLVQSSVDLSRIHYDTTCVSLLPNNDETICDIKNKVPSLSVITITPGIKKALIQTGKIVKVGKNINATEIESGDDKDDTPYDLYHLDILVTAKKQATTTLDGRHRKKIGINKIRFNVLNFVVVVPKEEKKGDEDEDNDNDGNDDCEYIYKIDTRHRNTKKDDIIKTFYSKWSSVKEHFNNPVNGSAIKVNSMNNLIEKKAGIKSPICVYLDVRSQGFTVVKGTDQLLQFIKKKEHKDNKDDSLIIPNTLGEKPNYDDVLMPTHFDR